MEHGSMKSPERSPIPASGLPLRRSPVRRLLVWAALAVPLAGGPFQDARAGCREVAQPLQEALRARDLDAARRHYEAVQGEFTCTDKLRAQTGRAVSNLHVMVAEERMAGGASLASQRGLLEQGNTYARTWRTLAYLGDVAYDERDYDRATGLYQEALMVLNNEGQTPTPPPDPEIERIIERAGLNRMLARNYVKAPVNRTRMLDGLAAPSIRGVKVEKVPLPITFRTNLAEFDERGRRYAEEMARFLIQQAPGRITISAHTDERGEEGYNLALSRRRGEAVRDFLRKRGFAGNVTVEAKGESERYMPPDPKRHSQEEIWRLNRRVVLKR